MADVRRSINTSFWSDEFNETLTPIEKYFFLYLLTNPYTNMCGVYKIGIKRICFETGLTEKEVNQAFQSLSKGFKAFYILPDGYVILRKFIKNQSFNPNMKTAVIKQLLELPNNIKSAFFSYVMPLESLKKHLFDGEPFESLSKPFEPVKEIESKIEIKIKSEVEKENSLSENPTDSDSDKHKSEFEIFRKAFTGTKLGLDTEFKAFTKKNKDYRKIIPMLLPAIEKENTHRQKAIEIGAFFPASKSLSVWLSKRCWEQELPALIPKNDYHKEEKPQLEYQKKGQSYNGLL